MPDIHIDRAHDLSTEEVLVLLRKWVIEGEEKFGLNCQVHEATAAAQGCDAVVHFERAGVKGSLSAMPGRFVLDADLGFLFRPYAPTIARKIENNLDELLASRGPALD